MDKWSLTDIYHIDASEARSKGFEEFENLKFDFVITVCDKPRKTCPCGLDSQSAHRGAPDPALATGTDEQVLEHVTQVAMILKRRIDLLRALPFDRIDRLRLQQLTTNIGAS